MSGPYQIAPPLFKPASRGRGGFTWLGRGQTFAGVSYPNSRINAVAWNDQNEVTYLDVTGGQTAAETWPAARCRIVGSAFTSRPSGAGSSWSGMRHASM